MCSPSGTRGTYFETGSSSFSLPSCASSTITAAVIVLVMEAIRKWVPAPGGVCVPTAVVPATAVMVPCGVCSSIMTPGTSASRTIPSASACNPAGSIRLSPAGPEAGGAVAAGAVAPGVAVPEAVPAGALDTDAVAAATLVGADDGRSEPLLHETAITTSAAAAIALSRRPVPVAVVDVA